ncbi:MAG: hypothetical protein ABGY11_01325 [Candidatus Thioglobus sp.]|jgi:hypothetical protein
MSSALDNLKANMAEQGMLTADGNIPQWLRGVEYGVPEVTPIQIGADIYNRGGGDGGVDTPPGVPRTPEQGFRDWWNLDDDLVGGRQISQGVNFLAGGGMLGAGLIGYGDYSYGVNPLADFTSMGLSRLAASQASNLPGALALSKAGAWGGQQVGNSLIGNTIGGEYIPHYTEGIKDSPWHDRAEKMGAIGTPEYDKAMNQMTGGLGYNKGVSPEIMKAWGNVDRFEKEGQSFIDDMWNTPNKEPESVSDFAGMFSGIGDSISNFFGFSDSNNSIDLNEIARNDTSVGVSDNSGGWSSADEQSYADEVGVSEY